MPKVKVHRKVQLGSIEAIQFLGNRDEILEFCGTNSSWNADKKEVAIQLFDGMKVLNNKDWIVKNLFGELFILTEEEFNNVYEVD